MLVRDTASGLFAATAAVASKHWPQPPLLTGGTADGVLVLDAGVELAVGGSAGVGGLSRP